MTRTRLLSPLLVAGRRAASWLARPLERLPLRQKLTRLISGLIAVIALFVFLFFPARMERQAVDALAMKAQAVAEMYAYSIRAALVFDTPDEVTEALGAALQFDDLRYAVVRDAEGRPVTSFKRGDYMAAPGGDGVAADGVAAVGDVYVVTRPVQWAGDRIGTVQLAFTLQPVYRAVARMRMLLLGVSVLIGSVGWGLAYAISVLTTRPLFQIVRAADRIAHGDLTQRAPRRTDDEVGQLATSFNAMVDGLASAYRDLERVNADLERHAAELVLAKEAAEEMARLKSAFLANMSHEIRTPLTGILGLSQVLAEEVDEHHREFAQLIEQSGKRLLGTLNSVLDLAQLEANAVRVELRRVDVVREAGEALRLLQPLAAQKGLDLRFEAPPPGHAFARLDRHCLHRILDNLVGNAIKFTDAGHVTVRVRPDGAAVRLEVEDTGVGIDEDFLPELFTPFQQESTGLSRSHEGSGLGLSITQHLVQIQDGRMEVHSRKQVGTTFVLCFPAAEAEPGAGAEAPARAAARPPSPAAELPGGGAPVGRVLVVEDNPEARRLVARLLEKHPRVDFAVTGADALDRFAAADYDLVLMDINLGDGMNGEEAMHALRRQPGGDVPVVAVTAYALPADEQRFLDAGFDDYLSKPFDRAGLDAVVARNLRRRVATDG